VVLSAARLYTEAFDQGLRPDPSLTVSEWADRHRRLSGRAASEPGPWRTARTPYLREIMDCLSPASLVERVVVMKGAQVGCSEAGNNWIGFCIHHAPGPMLAVLPTVEMAKRNSKQRIDPLIEESPDLRRLVKPARSRDSGNTVLAKEFPGGVLVMTGANSAVGLRSMPVRYLFLDEVDGYPGDVDGEGDPVTLAEARTRTFARRKIFIVSTPTIKGMSRIEREFEASDQRRYFVPCPVCHERQWLKFEQLKWEKDRPETAHYECEHCGGEIQEHHKTWMLEHGVWQPTAESDSNTAGFHLSSLYSPVGWRSWRQIAAAWLAAQGSDSAIKSVKNTELGETWEESGEAPDWQRLYDRREDYKSGTISVGGLFLTAGADVQKDRIEVSIWAWGRDKESWLVEHRIIEGDTSRRDVWDGLSALLGETWERETGAQLPIKRLAVDSGYATQEVYAWTRTQPAARVMAVKGVSRGSALVGMPTAVDVTAGGKRLRRGAKVYSVAGGIAKLELFNNLRKERPTDESGEPFPPGYVHLPKVDGEFCKQLCSEQLVTTRNRRGYPVRDWQKLRERNEALDCYVYARAAAAISGLDRFGERHWRDLERHLGVAAPLPRRTEDKIEGRRPSRDETTPPAVSPRSGWLGGRNSNWLRR
jgi:phage terminase large subunit GpA-like protein